MSLSLGNLFQRLDELKTDEEKAALLKKNDDRVVRDLISKALDPLVKWELPEGAPPFKKNKNNSPFGDTNLRAEWRRLYIFLKGGNNNVKQQRREALFLQLLQDLGGDEADLLISIKDKKLNISENVVRLAFPDLLPAKEGDKVEETIAENAAQLEEGVSVTAGTSLEALENAVKETKAKKTGNRKKKASNEQESSPESSEGAQ